MHKGNDTPLNLDFTGVLKHAGTLVDDLDKKRFLKQYISLLSTFAEYEPFKAEELLKDMPTEIQEEVWQKYSDEMINQPLENKVMTRRNQLHALIDKVDIEVAASKKSQPMARDIWFALKKHYKQYDDEEIIQEITPDIIYWISKDGNEQNMKYSTFKKQLSIIRKKRKST